MHNVIKEMERIAKKKVHHYLTDFYDYDKPIIERQDKAEYIWIVRKCGTWLYRWEDAGEIHDYYCDDKEVDFYRIIKYCDGSGSVEKIPYADRGRVKTFFVQVLDKYNYCVKTYKKMAWTREDAERMEKPKFDENYHIKVS